MSHHEHDASRPQPADVAHVLRGTDTDPAAARRAERQVAAFFGLATVLILTSVLVYGFVDWNASIGLPLLGDVNAINVLMGGTFGIGVFLIGIGAIHWAKKLMPDTEVVEERHALTTTDADRKAFAETFKAGVADSGIASHGIVRRSLLGALALFPIPLVVLLRDLGPSPSKGQLTHTIWKAGTRLVTDVTYLPIKADDIEVGGLINAVPEDLKNIEDKDLSLQARSSLAPRRAIFRSFRSPLMLMDTSSRAATSRCPSARASGNAHEHATGQGRRSLGFAFRCISRHEEGREQGLSGPLVVHAG